MSVCVRYGRVITLLLAGGRASERAALCGQSESEREQTKVVINSHSLVLRNLSPNVTIRSFRSFVRLFVHARPPIISLLACRAVKQNWLTDQQNAHKKSINQLFSSGHY